MEVASDVWFYTDGLLVTPVVMCALVSAINLVTEKIASFSLNLTAQYAVAYIFNNCVGKCIWLTFFGLHYTRQ